MMPECPVTSKGGWILSSVQPDWSVNSTIQNKGNPRAEKSQYEGMGKS